MWVKQFADRLINGVVLKQLGLKLSYRVGSDPIEDIVRLMGARRVDTVVDGGAYKGTFSRAMASAFPQAKIHAFEPTPASHELLVENVQLLTQVAHHRQALGVRTGTVEFYSNASPLTNSLRRSSKLGRHHFHNLVIGEKKLFVDVIKLADFALERGIPAFDIVKLDLQGNELDALHGMEELASSTQLALIEVQFTPLYEGAPVFSDIEEFMRAKGLILYQLYELVRSPNDGRLLYGDALFVKPEIVSSLSEQLVE